MRPAAIGAAAIIALAACGGTDAVDGAALTSIGVDATTTRAPPPGGPTPSVDPCLLLTASDLENATGIVFGEGAYNETLSRDELWICDWAASGSEFATAQVLIVAGPATFDHNRASAAAALGGVADAAVPGADDAYLTSDGSIVGMLIGDHFVQVAFSGSTPGGPGDVTVRIAAVVAGNLAT